VVWSTLVVSVNDKEVVVEIEGRHAKYSCAKVKRAFVPLPIRWTEVLEPGDARIDSLKMTDAVKAELDGLFKRGTFKIAVLPDPSSENVYPTKFVYSIVHEGGREIYKARFGIGVHRDLPKNHIVHTAPSLSHTSGRLLLAIAAISGWDVWTEDVQQAYLQSASFLRARYFYNRNRAE
jgi:hypothetical protein